MMSAAMLKYLNVCDTVIPLSFDTIQKNGSFTCDTVIAPAPDASTASSGLNLMVCTATEVNEHDVIIAIIVDPCIIFKNNAAINGRKSPHQCGIDSGSIVINEVVLKTAAKAPPAQAAAKIIMDSPRLQ